MAASNAIMTAMNSRGCSYHRQALFFLLLIDFHCRKARAIAHMLAHTSLKSSEMQMPRYIQVENKAAPVCDTMQTRRSHDQSVVHCGDLIGSDEDKSTQTGPIAARTNCK